MGGGNGRIISEVLDEALDEALDEVLVWFGGEESSCKAGWFGG